MEGSFGFESPAQREFRRELREWLAANLPPGWGTPAYSPPETEEEEFAFLLEWKRRLYEGGWSGLSWPKQYGGRGATPVEQAIFREETIRSAAPPDITTVGTNVAGPILINFANEEQKQRHLKPILTGEELWCQGFSEPSAGSDLASLRTRAVRQGDSYVVTGQKIWTSQAKRSHFMILLARTDPDAPKHRGISAFILPMDSPGLDVRPIRQISGASEFCEVFFDGVVLPAKNLVGELNQGWMVAVRGLSHERAGLNRAFDVQYLLTNLVQAACEQSATGTRPIDDPAVRVQLAQIYCEAHAARCAHYQSVLKETATGAPGFEHQAGKLHTSELCKRITDTAMSVLGPTSAIGELQPTPGWPPFWGFQVVNVFRHCIAGGTSQVIRNVLAERVLELPR